MKKEINGFATEDVLQLGRKMIYDSIGYIPKFTTEKVVCDRGFIFSFHQVESKIYVVSFDTEYVCTALDNERLTNYKKADLLNIIQPYIEQLL